MSLRMEIRKKLHSCNLDVSLSLPDGHAGLLGESGSGKSMTLKCIAGIEKPDEGFIEIDGRVVYDSVRGINLSPQQRHTGYLFQNYALFPHMRVYQNIELILSRKESSHQRRLRTQDYLQLFELTDVAESYPPFISGGQQQRLALARLLAASPSLILLDEPFSALDATIKMKVEDELSGYLDSFTGTIVLVTHNRDEAYRLCDHLIILDSGHVVERGDKEDLFTECHTLKGARITGCSNIARAVKAGDTCFAVPDWGLLLEAGRDVPEGEFFVGIRSHHIRPREKGDEVNCIDFTVVKRIVSPYSVSERLLALTPAGFAGGEREKRLPLVREYALSGEHVPEDSSRMLLHLPPEKIQLLVQ